MNKKYVMIDLTDERITTLADVISNKTSKRILDYLVDKEACEAEIVRDLNLPANTVNYNVKKLLEAGLIEKSKSFFWSVKGRKIINYHLANKKIIIFPKPLSTLKQMLLTLGIVGLISLGIKRYFDNKVVGVFEETGEELAAMKTVSEAGSAIESANNMPEIWLWFLIGGVSALLIYFIVRRLWEGKAL